MTSKPKLTLPKQQPVEPPAKSDYGDSITNLAAEELRRAEYNMKVALPALMERITADEALFRRLTMPLLHKTAKKRMKNLTRARTMAMQTKEAQSLDGQTAMPCTVTLAMPTRISVS